VLFLNTEAKFFISNNVKEPNMPLTASTVTAASTAMKKLFQLMSTATTDGSGANTLTIAHGFGSNQRISAGSDATNRLIIAFEPILPAGGLSSWYLVSKDATNLIVSKAVNAAASADAAVQCNMHATVIHSIVE
jgi:hypothetical protein